MVTTRVEACLRSDDGNAATLVLPVESLRTAASFFSENCLSRPCRTLSSDDRRSASGMSFKRSSMPSTRTRWSSRSRRVSSSSRPRSLSRRSSQRTRRRLAIPKWTPSATPKTTGPITIAEADPYQSAAIANAAAAAEYTSAMIRWMKIVPSPVPCSGARGPNPIRPSPSQPHPRSEPDRRQAATAPTPRGSAETDPGPYTPRPCRPAPDGRPL